MKLNELKNKAGARSAPLRLGRGIGSGKGGTSGRGTKGFKSRSGSAVKGFEGGQMPIYMRLPKRGFHNLFAKRYQTLNIGRLQAAIDGGRIEAGKPISEAELVAAGLVRKSRDGVRLLAKGEISAKVDITVAGASKTAVAAVETAGGKITLTAPVKSEAAAESEAN
jgi:large subunit ribosomal protein L15